MFSHLPPATTPAQSAADLAALALNDESSLRLPHFSSSDAVTLGLSLRKRFRSTHRHARGGSGALIGVYDALGHTLFACTVGDLGDRRGVCDVGLESWTRVKGMVEVVRRTSHSSFYVEKGLQAMGKTADDINLSGNLHITGGGRSSMASAKYWCTDHLNSLSSLVGKCAVMSDRYSRPPFRLISRRSSNRMHRRQRHNPKNELSSFTRRDQN